MKNTRTLSVNLPSDREISLTRVFKAPRQLVYDAFSKPEILKRWFGPRGWSLVTCDVDEGMSLTQVAKKHGISRASVCRLMKEAQGNAAVPPFAGNVPEQAIAAGVAQ